MSANKCAVCNKTSYPLESVTALEKTYHKACFKCHVCKQALNLKNFKGYEGKIYCFTHTPKPSATTVTDSVAIKTALAAPKKTSEGLGTVLKGVGGKPSIQVFGSDGSEAPAAAAAGGGEVYAATSQESYEEAGYQAEDPSYAEAPQETGDEYGGEGEEQQED